ncbi:metal ABC transporter permease [Anaerococcus tetradius]|uniref:ABC 3 transport family protein n=2 Tax=Anaerococcus tetradius TaxID=33036 RepID=A0A133KHS5_9FIRM|nr:metal ABC transporter permease [Anaerococcus tetradius]KWZ79153.1 ABC 3 transport family protein [Anaerococcus tetradius]
MFETLLILITTALSCSLLGVFLILRKLSMLTDAISHTVLLGIVLGFFITHDLSSPFLIIGASLMGIFTVFMIETIGKKKLSKYDDAIGMVFPFLFSLAVILISRYFRNVHLDTDVVLLGELLFSSIVKINILGFPIAKSLVEAISILFLVILFIGLFYKGLKISTFDPDFAKLVGIPTGLIFYMLMALTSLTAVISFNSLGAILVISCFIGPAACALLLSDSLLKALFLSALISIISPSLAFFLAMRLNVSISGMVSFFNLLLYFVLLLIKKYINLSKVKRMNYGKATN